MPDREAVAALLAVPYWCAVLILGAPLTVTIAVLASFGNGWICLIAAYLMGATAGGTAAHVEDRVCSWAADKLLAYAANDTTTEN